MSLNVVWYVSSGLKVWEKKLILDLAEIVEPLLTSLKLYGGDGQGWEGTLPVFSWQDRSLFRRGRAFLAEGGLWHFWGQAPAWARGLSLRASVVHSQWRDHGPWRGLPSTVLPAVPDDTQALVLPFFRSRSLWSSAEGPALHDRGGPVTAVALPQGRTAPQWAEDLRPQPTFVGGLHGRGTERGGVLERDLFPLWRGRGGALLLPLVTTDLAWLASQAALLGIPTMARSSALLDACLGSEGYVVVRGQDGDAWARGLDDQGRGELPPVAAAARRWIEERFCEEKARKALLDLYGHLLEVPL